METKCTHWSLRRCSLVLMAFLVMALGRPVFACDFDHPIQPDLIDFWMLSFGGPSIQQQSFAYDIDAREAAEPQLTAMLTMGELSESPSGTVVASAQPAAEAWTSDLGRSVICLSGTVMLALRCF